MAIKCDNSNGITDCRLPHHAVMSLWKTDQAEVNFFITAKDLQNVLANHFVVVFVALHKDNATAYPKLRSPSAIIKPWACNSVLK